MSTRFADLFAGIGGIRLGFEQAFDDARTVFVSEWDRYANKTYEANFGKSPAIEGDITKIAVSDIPDFDICLAGFPCQAFSIAGKHGGFSDSYRGQSRGTLFAQVVRVCEAIRPKAVFCENVKGLVHHDRGRTFSVITGAFEEIGYKTFYSVLNSKDFGSPKQRADLSRLFQERYRARRIYIPRKRRNGENDKRHTAGSSDSGKVLSVGHLSGIPSGAQSPARGKRKRIRLRNTGFGRYRRHLRLRRNGQRKESCNRPPRAQHDTDNAYQRECE